MPARRVTPEAAAALSLIAGVLLLGAVTLTTYRNAARVPPAVKQVRELQQVLSVADAMLARFHESQSARRAYLLAGDDYFRLIYRETETRADRLLDSLRALSGGDREMEASLGRLAGMFVDADSLGERTTRERRERGLEAAATEVRSRQGQVLVDSIEAEVRNVQASAQSRLDALLGELESRSRRTELVTIVGILLTVLLGTIAAAIILLDIRERRRTARALHESNEAAQAASRAKAEFLANMSHEIRTPLNGISGMIDLAMDTELTPRQRDILGVARNSSEALVRIVNDILDFSKIEAGRLDVEMTPFALRDVVGDTLRVLAMRAQQKGLNLAYRVATDVPDAVVGDVGRLRQVLINLVGNAIKFTDHGEIIVLVEAQETTPESILLHVAVRDTGPGIPADRRDSIFEPFMQADSSTTRRYGGTGLGLSISSQLVQLMGGRLWVDSEQGRGSVFYFTARLRPQAGAEQHRPPRPAADLPVLLVEAHATNRAILEEMLANWQMRPVAVANADDALARARNRGTEDRFRLLVVDDGVEGSEGEPLVESIRNLPGMGGTPAIILCADQRRCEVEAARAVATLLKPVKQSELFDAVVTLLGEPPARPATPGDRIGRVGWEGRKALVAEDNPVNQRVARGLLERLGLDVVIASNGREAVEAARRERFDIVLMDMQMPEMDGLEAMRRIREAERHDTTHTPIVAVTAHAMTGDRERFLSAGLDDYISKPIRPSVLEATLERLLEDGERVDGATLRGASGEEADSRQIGEMLDLVGGDTELLEVIADEFRAHAEPMMESIRAAVARRDANAVRAAAHKLKGAASQFAAHGVTRLASELENAGETGLLDRAERTTTALDKEMASLLALLDRVGSGAR